MQSVLVSVEMSNTRHENARTPEEKTREVRVAFKDILTDMRDPDFYERAQKVIPKMNTFKKLCNDTVDLTTRKLYYELLREYGDQVINRIVPWSKKTGRYDDGIELCEAAKPESCPLYVRAMVNCNLLQEIRLLVGIKAGRTRPSDKVEMIAMIAAHDADIQRERFLEDNTLEQHKDSPVIERMKAKSIAQRTKDNAAFAEVRTDFSALQTDGSNEARELQCYITVRQS